MQRQRRTPVVRTFDLAPTSEPKPTTTNIEADDLAQAYARTFGSIDGQRVLDDLITEASQPAIDTVNPNPYTAVGILFKQRLINYVHRKIAFANNSSKVK